MKVIKSFLSTYFAALGLIALPFIILLILSFWINVNQEVIIYGLTFSVLSSLVIAFNYRRYEKSVSISNENNFVNRFTDTLNSMGYFVKDKTEGSIVFEPSVHTSLFAGNISIHLLDNSAVIEGARLPVRKSIVRSLKNYKSKIIFQNTPLTQECLSKSFPIFEDHLLNSARFEQAEEITPIKENKEQISEED